jgi:hypothetical protein
MEGAMIWVSSGKGGWVFWSLFLTLGLMMGLEHYFLPPGGRPWPLSLAFAISGLFSVGLGLFARFSPPRLILERKTGRELMRRPLHSLYWIRAEYWGVLFLGLAIFLQSTGPARSG